MIDTTGTVTWTADHLPFGEVYAETNPENDPGLRYPGQWTVPEAEELGLPEMYYNLYRWYRAGWGRYSQSDPIGLGGGTNSFVYAGNNPFKFLDPIGLAYFASRPLDGLTWFGSFSGGVFSNPALNVSNCLISHEQLFFEDGKQPTNMGLFFPGGGVGPDTSYPGNASLYVRSPGKYDDCIARMAAESMGVGGYYNLLGLDGIGPQTGPGPKWNCQDWGAEVRRRYAFLESIRQVREQCCKKKGKRLWDMGNITLRR